jgi:hypothetical protein
MALKGKAKMYPAMTINTKISLPRLSRIEASGRGLMLSSFLAVDMGLPLSGSAQPSDWRTAQGATISRRERTVEAGKALPPALGG